MSAAADKRGLKRVCADCGNRFYDFNKRPIMCPSCATEFTGIEKLKGRKGRAAKIEEAVEGQIAANAAKAVANDDGDDDDLDTDDDRVISLNDLETLDDDGDDDGIDLDLDDNDDLDDLDVDIEPEDGPDDIDVDGDDDDLKG